MQRPGPCLLPLLRRQNNAMAHWIGCAGGGVVGSFYAQGLPMNWQQPALSGDPASSAGRRAAACRELTPKSRRISTATARLGELGGATPPSARSMLLSCVDPYQ